MVSLTTFPERIRTVWATIETLMRQTVSPDAVVLVLSVEEFPDRTLPRSVAALERRGLTVLWTPDNIGSYAKLVPTRTAFPSAAIVTADDDILYRADMLEGLVKASVRRPGFIVGHRGWNPIHVGNRLLPYGEWTKAGPGDAERSSMEIFLTGVGGVLYPPNESLDDLLVDLDTALALAPRADDVWFWAVARSTDTPRFCTGRRFGRKNGLRRLSRTLASYNTRGAAMTGNDAQLAAVIAHLAIEPTN